MKCLATPLSKVFVLSSLILFSCQPEPEVSEDPTKVLNDLVSPYGFIGFQNAMDRGEAGTHTGVLIDGRPSALAYVAAADSCFPQNDRLPRYQDRANIQKTYNYSFQGNLGFLTLGIPLISAGLGIEKSMTVEVELNGLVIEYMDSIDITDWYREDMRNTCRDYLEEVGFLIQTIHTDSMKISMKRLGGTNIGLNADNVNNYFQFEAGVNWQIVDAYTIEITTPHTLGYQIALMKPEDQGQALYRAMSIQEDSFVFERIGFSDFFKETQDDLGLPAIQKSQQVFLD
jgi:hypothetical protein